MSPLTKLQAAWIAGAALAAAAALGFLWSRFYGFHGPASPPAPAPAAPTETADRTEELARAVLLARENPKDAALALEAGSVAGETGRYVEALRWFRRAAALDPRLLAAITGQGQMWLEIGRPGLAAAAYERALKEAPNEPALHLELARAYTALRDFTAALRYARRAERLAPDNPEVYRALASVHLELLDSEHALRYAERACLLAPQQAENWGTRGYVLLRLRRFPEAERALRRAVAIDPANVIAGVLLARTLVEGQKTPEADREAFALLARARSVDPHNAQALLVQGQILTRSGDLPLAISLLRQAREQQPQNPEILLALGQALVRAGQSEEGARVINRSQQAGPRGVGFSGLENQVRKNPDPALVERLAELYRRQQMYDSAIQVLERALLKAPAERRLQEKLRAVRQAAARLEPL